MFPGIDTGEAFAEFLDRKAANKGRLKIDNQTLPAGSQMHFYCTGCEEDIVVPEDYLNKPEHCPECSKLKDAGLLQQFLTRAQSP